MNATNFSIFCLGWSCTLIFLTILIIVLIIYFLLAQENKSFWEEHFLQNPICVEEINDLEKLEKCMEKYILFIRKIKLQKKISLICFAVDGSLKIIFFK